MTSSLVSLWLAVLLTSAAIDQSKADGVAVPQKMERPESPVQISQLQDAQVNRAERKPGQDLERFTSDALQRELASTRMKLDAARAQVVEAQKLAEEQRELAAQERATNAQFQQDLLTLRTVMAAAKSNGGVEANLRRELAAARQELATMRVIAEGLAADLTLAKPELERLRAEAVAAHDDVEASVAGTRQTLEEERRKVERLEGDIANARQSIQAMEANATLAATRQTEAMRNRQLAEAGAKEAGEALARESERARSLSTDLETARKERDAANEELTRISETFANAWEQEHERAIGLAGELVAAHEEIEALKGQIKRNSRVENATKARPTDRASLREDKRKSARKPKVDAQNPKSSSLRLTKVLPDELLPTRPPIKGFGR